MYKYIIPDVEIQLKNLTLLDVECTYETIHLKFSDSKYIILSSYHKQDCCEKVYMDINDIVKEELLSLVGKNFFDIEIFKVENSGIKIIFSEKEHYFSEGYTIMINCYNQQNGFYSDLLLLGIESNLVNYYNVTGCTDNIKYKLNIKF